MSAAQNDRANARDTGDEKPDILEMEDREPLQFEDGSLIEQECDDDENL